MERWAELRREHFVRGVGIKELARRYGIDRNTVRRALRSAEPPRYQRPAAASKLDPFKDEIHELLRQDPRLPGVRVRELIEPLGFVGGKTIVDDYLREVRPLFLKPRTFQRTVYRPGEVCQFDLWHTTEHGAGRARPDPPGVCGRRRARILARWCGRVGVQPPSGRCAVGDGPVLVVAGCAAGAAGVGPGGVPARRRWPPDRELCRVLRAAADRLVVLRAGRSAGQGRRRAAAGIHGDELRAGPAVREPARLPAAARRLV